MFYIAASYGTGGQSEMHFRHVLKMNAGIYTCVANNVAGEVHATAYITVKSRWILQSLLPR